MREELGTNLLKDMDLVSTGGAPLPQLVGDDMVQHHNIRLVSRLGSSECGCELEIPLVLYSLGRPWMY